MQLSFLLSRAKPNKTARLLRFDEHLIAGPPIAAGDRAGGVGGWAVSFSTIFAVSSGSGRAGVAVIRVSGPAAGIVLHALAEGSCLPGQAVLRRLRDPSSGHVID